MTPFRGAQSGLPSQGILAAAVTSSLCCRCPSAQGEHLDALHGSAERKFSPFCWHKWTTGFEKCSSEHSYSRLPLNKDMCLKCCLWQAQWCVNYRQCCWNDWDLADDTWHLWQLGGSVSIQYKDLERERGRGKGWGGKKERKRGVGREKGWVVMTAGGKGFLD